ncbi:hypothetical protein F53441_11607 [Fusarium austroafricanum]|uniref:Peptidase S8/S53 domain-containing protein n=1 Tax=Fusarium austroafricanum TaxID=2364996 RepID=A0A8H4K530_9HYPO|nr:hypothetical protein F53441_11607 [Fusarium austroafricanum]
MVNLRNIAAIVTVLLGCGLAAPAPAVPAAGAGSVIPGSYIITLKPDVDATKAKTHIKWVTDIHKRSLTKHDTAFGVERTYDCQSGFQGYAGTFGDTTIEAIRKSSEVLAIEPNRVWKLSRVNSKRDIEKRDEITQKKSTWGLGTISHRKKGYQEYIYDNNAGNGTYAYVIDGGVRVTHNEFQNRAKAVWTHWKGDNEDTEGHGTHVAGTIAGKIYGVAKKANILALKVFQGEQSETSIILDAFNWAVNDIVKKDRTRRAVINMSLGGDKSAALNKAVDNASKKGVVAVVASGNDGMDAAKQSPASAASAITVGAIDSDWAVADFSNWGKAVDMLAPGVGITSAGYESNTDVLVMDGTSMAAPHVAGLVLYAMSVKRIDGVADVTQWLKDLATPKKISGNLRGSPNLVANNGNNVQ